jgi:S4 domain protein YaaA
MQEERVKITTEFITLGQFLKLLNIFDSGGMIKGYLKEEGVFVNGEIEHRRGRKLYPNDSIELEGNVFIVSSED